MLDGWKPRLAAIPLTVVSKVSYHAGLVVRKWLCSVSTWNSQTKRSGSFIHGSSPRSTGARQQACLMFSASLGCSGSGTSSPNISSPGFANSVQTCQVANAPWGSRASRASPNSAFQVSSPCLSPWLVPEPEWLTGLWEFTYCCDDILAEGSRNDAAKRFH